MTSPSSNNRPVSAVPAEAPPTLPPLPRVEQTLPERIAQLVRGLQTQTHDFPLLAREIATQAVDEIIAHLSRRETPVALREEAIVALTGNVPVLAQFLTSSQVEGLHLALRAELFRNPGDSRIREGLLDLPPIEHSEHTTCPSFYDPSVPSFSELRFIFRDLPSSIASKKLPLAERLLVDGFHVETLSAIASLIAAHALPFSSPSARRLFSDTFSRMSSSLADDQLRQKMGGYEAALLSLHENTWWIRSVVLSETFRPAVAGLLTEIQIGVTKEAHVAQSLVHPVVEEIFNPYYDTLEPAELPHDMGRISPLAALHALELSSHLRYSECPETRRWRAALLDSAIHGFAGEIKGVVSFLIAAQRSVLAAQGLCHALYCAHELLTSHQIATLETISNDLDAEVSHEIHRLIVSGAQRPST